jgi:cation diffusion facilitator CzcD-associated flavoprotein CzcO
MNTKGETKPVPKKNVAVIGGGISGISAFKAFSHDHNHNVTLFERSSSLGGVWSPSRSYPGVKTQSPKALYRFTDAAMPKSYPEWPEGSQVLDYLTDYAKKYGLMEHGAVKFGTNVVALEERKDQKSGWTVVFVENKDACRGDFDFVVICTGTFSDPNIVTHPCQSSFLQRGGRIIHSSEYSSSHIFNKRVVVIGGSKSATDLAVQACKNGAKQVYLVHRRNVWRLPYFLGGVNFKHLLFMRFQELQFHSWDKRHGSSWVHRFVAMVLAPLIWINFRLLELVLIVQLGLRKWQMVPKERIKDAASCELPIVTQGLFEGFECGSIVPIQATIDRYQVDQSNIILSNGQVLESIDTVIQATGWKTNMPGLPLKFQEALVDSTDGLFRLHRFAVNPNIPNMGFVGMNSSFCTVLTSEMISRWLVRYMDGMLAIQPTKAQMEENIEWMLQWKRKERPASSVYHGNCIAPFHFLHFEELFEDMGMSGIGWDLDSMFSYPKAEKFQCYLERLDKYSAC